MQKKIMLGCFFIALIFFSSAAFAVTVTQTCSGSGRTYNWRAVTSPPLGNGTYSISVSVTCSGPGATCISSENIWAGSYGKTMPCSFQCPYADPINSADEGKVILCASVYGSCLPGSGYCGLYQGTAGGLCAFKVISGTKLYEPDFSQIPCCRVTNNCATTQCDSGDRYCFDNCGNRKALVQDCTCSCISGPPSYCECPPDSTIYYPASNQQIATGDNLNFTGSGSDPDGDTIAGYEWTCAATSGTCPTGTFGFPKTTQNAGVIVFNTIGVYKISYRVMDSHNVWDPTPDTRTITVVNTPPTANAGADKSTQSGVAVSITGNCADIKPDLSTDGTITNCNWTTPLGCTLGTQTKTGIGTANATSTVNATCTGTTGQIFTLTLTATDNDAATGTDTMTITLANAPPTANAGVDKSTQSGVAVSLSGTCTDTDGTITNCNWNTAPIGCALGTQTKNGLNSASATTTTNATCDGATGTIFTFTLTATDNSTATATDTMTITIANTPPTANAGVDKSTQSGVAVSLSGTCADSGGTITNCSWTAPIGCALGTQTKTGISTASATSAVNATCTGAAGAAFTLTLTATDNSAATTTDTMVITLANTPPTANAGADKSTQTGIAIPLTGTCTDTDGTITNCNWTTPIGCTLGTQTKTGTGTASATSTVNATCTGSIGATFTLTLTATDNSAATTTDTMTITITITNTPPTANAGGPYTTTLPATQITLDGSASTDAEDCPTGGINCPKLSYSWSINGAGCTASATGVQPTINCTTAGTADVSLTVTDSGSPALSGTATSTITVSAAANQAPTATLIASPQNGDAPLSVTFTATCSDPENSLASCVLDFGDGTPNNTFASTTGGTISHTYPNTGNYTAELTATDNLAQTGKNSKPITVTVPPSAGKFRITSFTLEPNSVIKDETKTVQPIVKVTNLNSGSANAKVQIEVIDAQGNKKETKTSDPPRGVSSTKVEEFGAGDNIFFNVETNWTPGIYVVKATVLDTSNTPCDNSQAYLVVAEMNTAVPELGTALLPLIALLVLAIVFFETKKE